jgi:hypothetical protein
MAGQFQGIEAPLFFPILGLGYDLGIFGDEIFISLKPNIWYMVVVQCKMGSALDMGHPLN